MGRLAAVSFSIAFLGLIGARFLAYPTWLISLYVCVLFAGLGASFLAGVALSHMKGSWRVRAAALALTLALAAALRSLRDPLGVPAGEHVGDLADAASGPLSAAAAIAAVVIGFVGLGSHEKPGRYMAIASWALSGASIGSIADFLGAPIGPKTSAVLFLFAAVFISTLLHDESDAAPSPPAPDLPGASKP